MSEPGAPMTASERSPLVQSGDVSGLLDDLEGRDAGAMNIGQRLQELRTAVANLDGDPGEVIKLAFDRMLRLELGLLLRVQLGIDDQLRRHDQHQSEPHQGLPLEVEKTWLPRLAAVESRITKLSTAYTKIQHVLAIAERETRVLRLAPCRAETADALPVTEADAS